MTHTVVNTPPVSKRCTAEMIVNAVRVRLIVNCRHDHMRESSSRQNTMAVEMSTAAARTNAVLPSHSVATEGNATDPHIARGGGASIGIPIALVIALPG